MKIDQTLLGVLEQSIATLSDHNESLFNYSRSPYRKPPLPAQCEIWYDNTLNSTCAYICSPNRKETFLQRKWMTEAPRKFKNDNDEKCKQTFW